MKEFAISHASGGSVLFNGRHFVEAFTRWNYFPNQKASASELPPSVCTRRFTPEIARLLANNVKISRERLRRGFDLVEYRLTRYNNVSRTLGLIHPLAYSMIFSQVEVNRELVCHAMSDPNSAIAVQEHTDGRMLIMNYEDYESKVNAETGSSFGKRFRAHTDIGNCFGSIYTHSLEWALQGIEAVKAKLGNKSEPRHWSAELDRVLRWAKRNETAGLPIGPASSSIAVEIVLAAVDKMVSKQFSFVRYVDDYTALCDSHDEAQEFIRVLGMELGKYRLTLNLAKTSIVELPEPTQEAWVADLMGALPPVRREGAVAVSLSTGEVFNFLDFAVRLNKKTPDGSVLKFAVSMISHRVEGKAAVDVLFYVLNLSWHFPALLPYLEKIDARAEYYDRNLLAQRLNEVIRVNARHGRSDGMCWALYYLERLQAQPDAHSIADVIGSKDVVALALLLRFGAAVGKVVDYAKAINDADIYGRDRNWLLLYQVYSQGMGDDPYVDEPTFEIMRVNEVDFFCMPGDFSRAEEYCSMLNNPFLGDERPSFDGWMQTS